MANAVEKKAKPSFFVRVGNFFKRIGRFFKNMWHELKKVTWPSGKDVLNYSLVVIRFHGDHGHHHRADRFRLRRADRPDRQASDSRTRIMSENSEIKWYVVHTYSGYENKVKVNLEKSVENNGLQDKIVEVSHSGGRSRGDQEQQAPTRCSISCCRAMCWSRCR